MKNLKEFFTRSPQTKRSRLYRLWRIFAWIVAVILVLRLLYHLWPWPDPKLESNWDPDVAVLADIEISSDGRSFQINQVRDWEYLGLDQLGTLNYFDQSYDFADLENMYFYVQPLSKRKLIAHTFVVFDFGEKYGERRNLGLSIETRREIGEEYSLLGGIFKKFEIHHTWATAQDLTERRTVYMDYELKKYSVDLGQPNQIKILKAFIAETQKLKTKPRYYNTLTDNCTNALAKYLNAVVPEPLPWHYSFILTGKSAEYLMQRGYLESGTE